MQVSGIWAFISYCFICVLSFFCGSLSTKNKEREKSDERKKDVVKKVRKLSTNIDTKRTSRWVRD